ncbi:MAG: O-antigen polymerase [Bacilli bacterium]
MIKRFVKLCIDKKTLINSLFSIVLIFYFVGVFIPNVTVSLGSVSTFFNFGVTKIIWRIFIAAIFGIYMLLAFIANQIRPNRLLIIASIFIFALMLMTPIINIASSSYQFMSLDTYSRLTISTVVIGFSEVIAYYGNIIVSFIFFFALLYAMPLLMKEAKHSKLVLYVIIGIMMFLCFYSFFTEYSKYGMILRGQINVYENDIHSLFASKNAFGLFLYQAALICGYLFFSSLKNDDNDFVEESRKKKLLNILWFSLMIFFMIVAFFTINKNSILAIMVFVLFLVFVTFRNFNKHKTRNIIAISLISVAFLFFILIMTIPAIYNVGIFNKIYLLFSGSGTALGGRAQIVNLFFNQFNSYHLFFGFGPYLGHYVYAWSLMTNSSAILYDLHNSYITILGEGGIFYFIFYIGLLIYAGYKIFKLKDKNINITIVCFGILISFLVYSFFESPILFISGSSESFVVNILLFVYPLSLSDKAASFIRGSEYDYLCL